jgi:hypothetical protein
MAQIEFVKKLTKIPAGKVQIFKLAKPNVTKDTVMAEAEKLQIPIEKKIEIHEDAKKLSIYDRRYLIAVYYRSNALQYRDKSKWQKDNGKINIIAEDKEFVNAAERILKKQCLTPSDTEKLLKVSRLKTGLIDREGQGSERTIEITPIFQRVIDGIPVDGPGGKIAVFMNKKKEVTGINRIWRKIEKVHIRNPKLNPPEFAVEYLRKYYAEYNERITVEDFRFGYFEQDKNETQEYLQPAYVLMLKIGEAKDAIQSYSVHVIPAAVEPIEALMPPEKKPQESPHRT